jgi:hypothetical protein
MKKRVAKEQRSFYLRLLNLYEVFYKYFVIAHRVEGQLGKNSFNTIYL